MAAAGVVAPVTVSNAAAVRPAPSAAPIPAPVPLAGGPLFTLLFGRAMWEQTESCQPVAGQPTLFDIAAALAARGVRATGVVVPARTDPTLTRCINGNLYPSWAQLGELRDSYGWTFVSNGMERLDITKLSPAGQVAESCGSIDAFEAHGHYRAWGMYGPGSNHITDAISTKVIAPCFAFTRFYSGSIRNSQASVTSPPYYARTDDTSAGSCRLAPCSGSSGGGRGYMLPSEMIAELQAATPGQWIVMSTYKLVIGVQLKGDRRWDCTSADPRKHWATGTETYCLDDLLTALDALPPTAVVTDPAGVARAWGRVPPTAPSGLRSLPAPARLLDTRPGATTVDGVQAGRGRVAGGTVVELPVAARAGLSAQVASVALNLTVVGPVAAGYASVFPCGGSVPLSSNVNFRAGATMAASVLTGVGTGGRVCLVSSAATDLIVDVSGGFNDTTSYRPLPGPVRLADTRRGGATVDGRTARTGPLAAGAVLEVPVAGRGGLSASASAMLTVTGVGAAGPGYLTVYPCGEPQPTTSTVNLVPGAAVANGALARLGPAGSVCIATSVATDVLVDVAGSFPDTAVYVPLAAPVRLLDSRPRTVTSDGRYVGQGPLGPGAVNEVVVAGRAGLPGLMPAIALNVTVTQPAADGFLTVFPCGEPVPGASTLNYRAGETVANLALARVGASGKVCLVSSASTHVIIDATGAIDG